MSALSLLFIRTVLAGAAGGNGTGFGVRVGNMSDNPPTAIVGPVRTIEISSVRPGAYASNERSPYSATRMYIGIP